MTLINPSTNQPFTAQELAGSARTKTAGNSFLQSLVRLDAGPKIRAQKPMENHVWVYAAVFARAKNISQVPFYLWRETETQTAKRRARVKNFVPRSGKDRTATLRHLSKAANPGRFRGFRFKELEMIPEHPLMPLMQRPNEHISGAGLILLTEMWLGLRGECIWLLTTESGQPVATDVPAQEIWPMSPDLFEPRFVSGRMVGWWFRPDKNSPLGNVVGARIPLSLNEVVQFKYPNPNDPYRGLSPLSAAANGIALDMLIEEHNRKIIENGAEPGGILTYDGELDPDEKDEAEKRWNQRHAGSYNERKTAILKNGWAYQQISMSPKDLEYAESKRWNRDTILAILGVPKTVIGVTEELNYATQLGQDKNFWDKTLIPDVRLIEDTIDSTILFQETDDIVAAFDLSNVEALREGMDQQVSTALKLMDIKAHMPPRDAFELAGLSEVPEYLGDDVSLIAGLTATTVDQILNPGVPEPPVQNSVRVYKASSSSKRKIWEAFVRAQSKHESAMRSEWRRWMEEEERLQLEQFDKVTRNFDVTEILLPIEDLQTRLGTRFRPHYTGALQSSLELFETETGEIAVFELDDPLIQAAFDARIEILRKGPPVTLQKRLLVSIQKGLEAGESIGELRERVSHVYGVGKSSPKALQVARTESASFMNSARDAMQRRQGFKKVEWVTAADEHVRSTHEFFGSVGPVDIGTNFLTLPGYPGSTRGTLEFPGDPRAGADELVNCRCVRIVTG